MPAILPHFMRRSILFHLNIARQKLLVFCAFLIILTFVGNTLAALTPYQDFLSQNVNALNSRSLTVDSIEVDQEVLIRSKGRQGIPHEGECGIRHEYRFICRAGQAVCMARKPKLQFAGACHYVIARGNGRGRLFYETADYAGYPTPFYEEKYFVPS